MDPALVHQYFGTKQRLFIEAVDFPIDAVRAIESLAVDDVDHVGERLVRFALRLWDDPLVLPRLLGVLRSAVTDPEAAKLLGALFTRQGPVQLVHAIGRTNRTSARSSSARSWSGWRSPGTSCGWSRWRAPTTKPSSPRSGRPCSAT